VKPDDPTAADAPVAPGTEATAVRDPVIGTEVSGYRVKSRLGVGGMGIVYEGEQPLIGKRVAIKVLRHEIAADPEIVRRLVAEARAVNQVGHRGIIDVFGVGELADGRQCIVMELLDGEPLEAVLQAYRTRGNLMPLLDALVILEEICSALAAAHTAGVIHRDLKPSNIFLCTQRDGTRYVKLLDFGIAKLGVLGNTPSTRASMMVGTPGFMAPEQVNSGVVSPALDLYAAGVIAFELFAGRPPFEADSLMGLLVAHSTRPPPSLRDFTPTLPEALEQLVGRLLAKKPEDRPASAEEVGLALSRVRRELLRTGRLETVVVQPLEAPTEPRPAPSDDADEPLPRVRRRSPSTRGALALGLCLLVGAGVWVLSPGGDASGSAATAPSEPPPTAPSVTPSEVVKAPETVKPPEPAAAASAAGATKTKAAPSTVPPAPATMRPASLRPAVTAARPSGLPPASELARRVARIRANLARARALGDDPASLQQELELVLSKLKTAPPADAERLNFRLTTLEAESAP
jgi:serine/threonine-protein kinase